MNKRIASCPACGNVPRIAYCFGEYFVIGTDGCEYCDAWPVMSASTEREIMLWNERAKGVRENDGDNVRNMRDGVSNTVDKGEVLQRRVSKGSVEKYQKAKAQVRIVRRSRGNGKRRAAVCRRTSEGYRRAAIVRKSCADDDSR